MRNQQRQSTEGNNTHCSTDIALKTVYSANEVAARLAYTTR